MFSLFRRKRKETVFKVVELPDGGFCAVAGESHYQDALRATHGSCTETIDGRPAFTAVLIAEPENPHDRHAVAVYSAYGKLGYLPRDDAFEFADVFAEIARRGHDGGCCVGYLVGGSPDKPSLGVVLQLADPFYCLSHLDDDDALSASMGGGASNTGRSRVPREAGAVHHGYVRGRHFTEYVEEVKELRRTGREEETRELLLELVAANEDEARHEGWGVAPWYYEQLAISYRKTGNLDEEIAILERYTAQRQAPGATSPKLHERLEKARLRAG